MAIRSVFVFLCVLACAINSRAEHPPPESDASRPTFSLWEGFDLSLPNQNEIGSVIARTGEGISQAVDAGKQKVDESRNGPVGTATTETFSSVVQTSKDKLQEFDGSGLLAGVGNWAIDVTSDLVVLVDKAETAFQESQIAHEAQKLAAYVKQFGEDCIRDFAGGEVPETVLVWFSEARNNLDRVASGFKQEEIPKAVLKWMKEHPAEIETAGWVLKNGVYVALAVNPAIAWSPLLRVLGWGSGGPILGMLFQLS